MSKIKKILDIIFDKEEKEITKDLKIDDNKEEVSIPVKHEPKPKPIKKVSTNPTSNKKYLTVTEIAKSFEVSAVELNHIFSDLKWAYKENRWWLATELGISLGAKQCYHTKSKVKYIQWHEAITKEFVLINAIKRLKESPKTKELTSKEKGELYETFVAEHYKQLDYFVWEHGKEKGKLDGGIDLIVKKKKEIIFIQCKNWKENTRFKIDHVRVKASRAEARQFMKSNPLFVGYKMKFRYTLSNDCMHPSAIKYIEENSELFDYEVLSMKECQTTFDK